MNNHIENEFSKLWIENDILFFVYKKGVTINLAAAAKIVDDRLRLQDGKAYLIFCDMRRVKSVDKAARSYFAAEGSVLVKAVALLVEYPLTDALSGFYIKTSRPPVPTQGFTDEKAAFEFLETYR